jgi:hypothetical protein
MSPLLCRVRFGRELLNFIISPILPPRERIEFGLGDNHLFVRPAHGDELADQWHLQFALGFQCLVRARMFGNPM